MIRKKGDEWCLYSATEDKKGKRKNLGCYSSLEGAQNREKQVLKFKHMKKENKTMHIKKSEIYKIIQEELEVVLTNEEVEEMFELDMSALLDEMMSEEEGDENWMQKAFSKKKGSLKRMLKVPKDKTISVSKMAGALRAGGEKEEKARAAVNANPEKYGSIKNVGVEKKKKKKG